jgi:RNA polymerase sigma-70 factor (ECF subfamily)
MCRAAPETPRTRIREIRDSVKGKNSPERQKTGTQAAGTITYSAEPLESESRIMSSHLESAILLDEDAELVASCQAGGPDADACFAELVRRHSPRILRRATRMLGNESEAEDVVQEVFVNVHRFLDRYQPDRPFNHWLSVVTLNACRIELRRRAGRDRRHDAFRRDPIRETDLSIKGDVLLRGWLSTALEDLHPVTRDCVVLRAVDGLSYRDVGARCGLTEAAAKMRVLRGLRELRERYSKQTGRGLFEDRASA